MQYQVLFFVLLCFYSVHSSAQIVRHGNYDNYEEPFNKDINIDDLIGTPYLNDSWAEVRILIKGKSRLYQQAKYNLHMGYMEVMVDGAHKFIKTEHLTSFKFPNADMDTASIYIDIRNMIIDNKKFAGILLLTQVSEKKVITAHKISIRKASKENPHLAGTENKGRILLTKENYILTNGQMKKIKKDKDLLKLFPDRSKSIKRLLKSKKANLKEHSGIVQILRLIG